MHATPMSASRRIVVLGTGGTIAGASPQAGANLGYTAGTVPVSELLGGITAPQGVALHAEQVAQLDSKDMDLATWAALFNRCTYWLAQDDVAGIVITHGTDTVEETAFFLQASLASRKPVVCTCAMRPATASAPDGPQNLRDAIAVAAMSGAAGVVVVCAGAVHGALDVRKQHPYRLDAFSSGDAGVLGYVEEGRVRMVRPWPDGAAQRRDAPGFTVPPAGGWPQVEIVTSHAGASGALVDALVQAWTQQPAGVARGIVLAATGNGSLHRDLEAAARRAEAAGVAIRIASRCAEGQILPGPQVPFVQSVGLSPVKARIDLMLELLEQPTEESRP